MMPNHTPTSEFLLLEFSDIRELQILYFLVFLILYLTALLGNLLILMAVAFDHHLHTPMYFFLMNLSILDISSLSVLLPKAMNSSLMNNTSISYSGCVAQVSFYLCFVGSNFSILTVMAHDRHIAICKPLHYETIMHRGACIQMAAGAWIAGILYGILHTGGTFSITFCSNMVNQFFCEIPQLIKLSCSDMYLVEVGIIIFSCFLFLGCFMFIVVSYMHIFAAVLRIPSMQGQKKALSTCLPHLTVVSLFLFTGILAYMRPPSHSSSNMDIGFAVGYAILPPLLNPFIYSIRNKDIRAALLNVFGMGHFSKVIAHQPFLQNWG